MVMLDYLRVHRCWCHVRVKFCKFIHRPPSTRWGSSTRPVCISAMCHHVAIRSKRMLFYIKDIMNRLSNMTRLSNMPVFRASSLELIGEWLDVQIELLFNVFRFLGTPGWDAQAVSWFLWHLVTMCWDINFQLKIRCLMLWKTTSDLTLGWEWRKFKDQKHSQIAVWGLTCGLKRWPSKTTPWSILGRKQPNQTSRCEKTQVWLEIPNVGRYLEVKWIWVNWLNERLMSWGCHSTQQMKWPCGVEICDSHNKTNQNPLIKEAVDRSIYERLSYLSPQEVLHFKVLCLFWFCQKEFVSFPVGLQGWSTACYLDVQGFQSMSPSTFSWQGAWQPHMETLKLWLCCSRCGLLEGEATFQHKMAENQSGKEIPANIVSLGVDVHLDSTNHVRVSTI